MVLKSGYDRGKEREPESIEKNAMYLLFCIPITACPKNGIAFGVEKDVL